MRKRTWTIQWQETAKADGMQRLGQAVKLMIDASKRSNQHKSSFEKEHYTRDDRLDNIYTKVEIWTSE